MLWDLKRGQCHTLLCHGFKPVDAENIKKKIRKKKIFTMLLFLLCANKACPYAHKAHMDPIPLLYLFFFCCLKLFGHKQFTPVLPQQQDGKVPVLFGSWSDSYDEHTTHTHKKNQTSIIYYHSTYVNTHERSGGDSGRACGTPVTGNQEYPDYGLFLQKRTCVWLSCCPVELFVPFPSLQ